MSKRAFTISELIVISAVLILSIAVVIPTVSAQGGSKGDAKTWHIEQLRRLGIVCGMYSFDWDDHMPQAAYKRPDWDETWGTNLLVPSPGNAIATAPWNTPERIERSNMIWRNSTTPYSPYHGEPYPNTFLPGAPLFTREGEEFAAPPNQTHPTMNGLLHCYSFSAMNNPSLVPLLWSGASRTNLNGRTISNPALSCLEGPDCLFNPTGAPTSVPVPDSRDGIYFSFDYPVWIFGQFAPMIMTDLSIRLVPIGLKTEPDMHAWPNINVDPWQMVDASGKGQLMAFCGPGHTVANPVPAVAGQGSYPCFFRPDREE